MSARGALQHRRPSARRSRSGCPAGGCGRRANAQRLCSPARSGAGLQVNYRQESAFRLKGMEMLRRKPVRTICRKGGNRTFAAGQDKTRLLAETRHLPASKIRIRSRNHSGGSVVEKNCRSPVSSSISVALMRYPHSARMPYVMPPAMPS